MDALKHPMVLSPAANMNLLDAALFYLERRISVLPVNGKRPSYWSWSEYQTRRATSSHVQSWAEDGFLMGVGIVCGKVSENLVVIDLDGEDAVQEFSGAFPSLLDTYQVLSGSGKGRHLYYYVDDLPSTTRRRGFELRANGCYVVAPPSLHPDTRQRYQPMDTRPVTRLPHMQSVVTWIREKLPKPSGALVPPPPAQQPSTNFSTDYVENGRRFYFNRALEGEIRRVTNSTHGTRNDNLNMAAFCMGGLVLTAGEYSQVQSALLDAALTVGTPEIEARRTIKSGLDAGMRKPRRFPGVRGGNHG